MLIDNFFRIHDYLRISLTDNCNLRCAYCMPEEHYQFMPSARLMQADEIEHLAKVFVANGVKKIRLTGGEPLVRKDFKDILKRLSTLPVQLNMTTNATRLHLFWDDLEAAHLKTLNISLDTLYSEKFKALTRRDNFQQVKDNIDEAIRRGFEVKVNMVVMKGWNDDEILDFVAWTKSSAISIRFIEFMPFEGNAWESEKVMKREDLIQLISDAFPVENLPHGMHDTAVHFKVKDFKGSLGCISTMTAPFCAGCNRIRLTADGKLKNCLFSQTEMDLLTPLRAGKEVLPLIVESIQNKAKALGGQFTSDIEKVDYEQLHNRSMIAIGG